MEEPKSETLDWALRYAALGLPVVPLHGIDGTNCTCGKADCSSPGKHPLLWRGLKDATTDAERLTGWFTRWPTANLGIVTGGSVIVLDVDGAAGAASTEGKVIPTSWTAKTGRGLHIWFKHPGGTVPNFAHRLPGLDLRGEGGYVVVPPSVHVSGVGYVWLTSPWDCELADAPAWLLELIASSSPPKPSVSAVGLQRNPTPDTPTPDWAVLLRACRRGSAMTLPSGQRGTTWGSASTPRTWRRGCWASPRVASRPTIPKTSSESFVTSRPRTPRRGGSAT